jgi:hypothetical protein
VGAAKRRPRMDASPSLALISGPSWASGLRVYPHLNRSAAGWRRSVKRAGLWLMLMHPVVFLVCMVLFILILLWLLPRLWRGVTMVWRRITPT